VKRERERERCLLPSDLRLNCQRTDEQETKQNQFSIHKATAESPVSC